MIQKILIMLLFFVAFSWGETAFEKGNRLYQENQYAQAEESYRQALKEEGRSSAIFYNLSNALYRQQRLGEAILFLEKARRINPKDSDILANLAFLQAETVDAIPEPQRGLVGQWLFNLYSAISLTAQLWLMVFLSTLFATILGIVLFKRHTRAVGVYALLGIFALLLALSISVTILIQTSLIKKYAIVLGDVVEAKNEPQGATLLFTIHEGTKTEIIKSREGWYFVKLANGVSGWIPVATVGLIE